MQKVVCNNPKVDLVNMNAYIYLYNLVKWYQFVLKTMSRNKFWVNLGPLLWYNNLQKMMCNNPKLDLVNMNYFILYLLKVSQFVLKILSVTKFWRKSRAITLVQMCQI